MILYYLIENADRETMRWCAYKPTAEERFARAILDPHELIEVYEVRIGRNKREVVDVLEGRADAKRILCSDNRENRDE